MIKKLVRESGACNSFKNIEFQASPPPVVQVHLLQPEGQSQDHGESLPRYFDLNMETISRIFFLGQSTLEWEKQEISFMGERFVLFHQTNQPPPLLFFLMYANVFLPPTPPPL